MTHQHVTDAIEAATNLRRSLELLDTADTGGDDGLKAWRPGTVISGGGKPSDISDFMERRSDQAGRHTQLVERVRDQINQAAWVLRSALPDAVRTTRVALDQIVAWLPLADPTTARDVGRRLADTDRTIIKALRLDPADQLPRDPDGNRLGTAAQLAQLLNRPDRRVTEDTVWDWARRSRTPGDPLHGRLPAINVPGPGRGGRWYKLDDAIEVARVTNKPRVRSDHNSDVSGRTMPAA